jgi:hypothetical protein
MIKFKRIICLVAVFGIIQSCSTYSFTGIQTGDARTFQVNFFQNMANLIEPGIDQEFTNQLQNLVVNQTSLDLVTSQGDIIYEGEITEYRISPMTATADQRAAQNRLTITVNVRYINTLDGNNDFEKPFSFFFDYPADQQLVGGIKDAAIEIIFERLTLDILNSSLGSW